MESCKIGLKGFLWAGFKVLCAGVIAVILTSFMGVAYHELKSHEDSPEDAAARKALLAQLDDEYPLHDTTPTESVDQPAEDQLEKADLPPTSEPMQLQIDESKTLPAEQSLDPQMPRDTFPPIRDADALEAELDKFPHLQEHPNFEKLRADCDTYFHALQYKEAHERGEISLSRISKEIGATDTHVGKWLVQDKEPRLLWLIHHERTQASFIEHLLQTDTDREPHDNPILRAANNPEFRNQLFPPGEFTPHHLEHLLKLRNTQDQTRDPTQFTNIQSYKDYEDALRAFPLIQTLPNFDQLHQHMQLYYRLKDNPPHKANGKLPIGALTEHYNLTKGCVHRWLKDETQPQLKTTLEQRATTLKDYQTILNDLRQRDNGITTPHHLHLRIGPSHFHFWNHLYTDPQFDKQLTDAVRYLTILKLVDDGHHPADLDRHFNLHKDYTGDTLRYHHRPHLIKLAATIPAEPPKPNHRWLPTTNDDKRYPTRYIHAPHTISDWKQILSLLDQLPTPTNPDVHLTRQLIKFELDKQRINQRIKEYGPVETPDERLLAFAYLIGTALGDGWI